MLTWFEKLDSILSNQSKLNIKKKCTSLLIGKKEFLDWFTPSSLTLPLSIPTALFPSTPGKPAAGFGVHAYSPFWWTMLSLSRFTWTTSQPSYLINTFHTNLCAVISLALNWFWTTCWASGIEEGCEYIYPHFNDPLQCLTSKLGPCRGAQGNCYSSLQHNQSSNLRLFANNLPLLQCC